MRRLYPLVVAVTLLSIRAANADPAQDVADLEMRIASAGKIHQATAELEADRDRAVDRWLRAQLATVAHDDSDAALARLYTILLEADKRHRADVLHEAEARGTEIIEHRASELEPLIAAARWHDALARLEGWVSGAAGPGQAVKQRIQQRIRVAIDAQAKDATTAPERFLFQRMHRWLGDPLPSGADVDAMNAIDNAKITFDRGSTTCPVAAMIDGTGDAKGTPMTVQLALGSCPLQVRRTDNVPRTGTFTVQVEHTKQEEYTEMVDVQTTRTSTEPECHQEYKEMGTGPNKTNELISVCGHTTTQTPVTVQEPQTRTRTVTYTEPEERTEEFLATTHDTTVSASVTITVSGDGESVTVSDRVSAEDHDEEYTRSHGPSRSFRTDTENTLNERLRDETLAIAKRAINEWRAHRAQTRLARARAATNPHERRAHATEAVLLDPTVAATALPLIDLKLEPAHLATLVAGDASLAVVALPVVPALALPDGSASLRRELERQETRYGVSGGDGLFAFGLGMERLAGTGTHNSMDWEIQMGFVPVSNATSALLTRVEGDLQLYTASSSQLDFALRPELGLRLPLIAVSAVVAVGAHVAWRGASIDKGSWGDLSSFAYAGYGGHVALSLGPLLLDALVLREHLTSGPAIATRADAIVGYKIKELFYAIARARFVAPTDLGQATASEDRLLSVALGLMTQF